MPEAAPGYGGHGGLDADAWRPMRKVYLLSGTALEVRGCSELRAFKLALSKELRHPAFLITVLCDGVAITCDDEWQKVDSSNHLVAVQSCPFMDFVADFDQDLIEAGCRSSILL